MIDDVQHADSSVDTPDAIVSRRFFNEVATFKAGRQFESSVHKQLKDATELTAQEYGDRFLVELIQNAYDALGDTSAKAKIRVILDEGDGEWGSLLVANTGREFSRSRFDAICQFAQSSKTPGESIGNKGIGFRSVLQISDWPEVYSRRAASDDSGAPEFDGFCFRFADAETLLALTNDAELTAALAEDVSPYSLPVPIYEQGPAIARLAQEGFATVVRLPLRNAQALAAATGAFDACIDGDVPLLLFLRRLGSLELARFGGPAQRNACLMRHEVEVAMPGAVKGGMTRVTLSDAANAVTLPVKFLCASDEVSEAEMLRAIEISVELGKLPREWKKWKGPGKIAIALSLTGASPSRLYNYLPMGPAAACPFEGILDAPFFARLDRTTLSEAVPLNNLLLDRAAALALRTADRLATGRSTDYAPFVARLVAWSDLHRPRLVAASLKSGVPLARRALIPVAGGRRGQQRYSTLADTYVWIPPRPTRVFSASRLATDVGLAFLDERISPSTAAILAATKAALVGNDLTPTQTKLADWAEALAKKLPRRRSAIDQWDLFYADLAITFAHNVALLQRRPIILGDRYTLLRAGGGTAAQNLTRSEPMVFLSPVRRRTEGEEEVSEEANLDIPAPLSAFIRYTHPRLEWTDPETKVSLRQFFASGRLLRAFRSRELLEVVRSLLDTDRSNDVYAAALELAFRVLGSGTDSSGIVADALNLRVPVRGGVWIDASDSIFSEGWGRRRAQPLAELLGIIGDSSPELVEYSRDLILSRSEWPFPIADRNSFATFLDRIGVKDGLWPSRVEVAVTQRPGHTWTAETLGKELHLSAGTVEAWARERSERSATLQYPTHQYRLVDQGVWTLPGQDTHQLWPEAARARFAELIAGGLQDWRDEVFWTPFANLQGNDRPSWPSPVLALLSGVAWLPAQGAESRESAAYLKPGEVWLTADEGEHLPEFLPGVRYAIRNALTGLQRARSRTQDLLGAKFWDRPTDAPSALSTLARLFDEGVINEEAVPHLAAHTRHKWSEALQAGSITALKNVLGSPTVLVKQKSRLDLWTSGGPAALVLCDDLNPLRTQLLEESGAPLVVIEPLNAVSIAALTQLHAATGSHVLLASQLEFALTVDDKPFKPSETDRFLRETTFARLGELTALFIAVSAPAQTARERSTALERLQSIRVVVAERMRLSVVGIGAATGSEPKVLAYPHDRFPTLLVTDLLARIGPLSPSLAHPLSELLGMPEVGTLLQLVLFRAQQWSRAEDAWRDDGTALPTELAIYALDTKPERIREARLTVGRSLTRCVVALLPVVCCALDDQWTDETRAALMDAKTLEELLALLQIFHTMLPATPEVTLNVCRLQGRLEDVRDQLGLDYGRFNHALTRLGGSYLSLTDPEGHSSCFLAFVERSHEWIDDTLRRRYWDAFVGHQLLSAYLAGRARDELLPDPAWLERFALPPDEVMRARVGEWLAEFHDLAVLFDGAIPPLQKLRQTNAAFLDGIQERIRTLIVAWCSKRGTTVPEYWRGAALVTRLAETAHTEGWSDFGVLDESYVLKALAASGRWPAEMPRTTDPLVLGLAALDLSAPQLERDRERQARDTSRRSLIVNGQTVLVKPEHMRALADLVVPALPDQLLSERDRVNALAEMGARGPAKRGRTSRGGSTTTHPTDEQRYGIGFLGEVVVREWLRRQYPEHDVDECWKSEYKNALLGRTDGSDWCGFDFEILTPRRRLMYEVKASVGDDWQFEMGESEVREAQKASSDERRRYRIVYVANVTDATRTRLLVLPNPFSAKGASLLQMIGTGMRFRFNPSER